MCEASSKLDLIQKWWHRCAELLSPEEIKRANHLARSILDLLNVAVSSPEGDPDSDEVNGVKFLAVLDVLLSGVDHMEQRERERLAEMQQSTSPTIH